ncbi:MAG: phage baseplate assembly protein V [Terriglobia bacterium]|nr:phage baseplate assembly protein V [Terriglobia bacterium]
MIDHIKRVVSEFMGTFTFTKYGQISAYNPNDYTVKVLILPNLTDETGFIPLSAPWVGNNFGAVFGPGIGDSVRLDFMDGRVEATVVGGRFFNNSARPPVVQSGQAAIVDSKGSYVKLNNDGTITFGAPVGITSTTPLLKQVGNFEVDGNTTLNGDITQTVGSGTGTATLAGNLTAPGTITGQTDVIAGTKSGKTHIHADPQGGDVGPPI